MEINIANSKTKDITFFHNIKMYSISFEYIDYSVTFSLFEVFKITNKIKQNTITIKLSKKIQNINIIS